MYRAEVRDGYVYVIDTNTGQESSIVGDLPGRATGATVTGDDEITIAYGDSETKYRISSGQRA